MQVTAVVTRKDLLLAWGAARARSSAPYRRFLGATLATLIALMPFRVFGGFAIEVHVLLLAAILGGIAGSVFVEVLEAIVYFQARADASGRVGPAMWTLAPEGIYETTSHNAGFGAWGGVKRILVTGPYLVIQCGPEDIHVIPRRGFRSANAFGIFVEEARQLWADACGPTPTRG